MTELLYHMDSYMQDFEATIVGVDDENHSVILDRSAVLWANEATDLTDKVNNRIGK